MEARDHLENLSTRRTIFKCILNKQGVTAWNGFDLGQEALAHANGYLSSTKGEEFLGHAINYQIPRKESANSSSLTTLFFLLFFPSTVSSLLRDRLSERKPVSFAELGPCFLFGSRRRNGFVLLFSSQEEVRCRVFPQILSSHLLTGIKLHFSLGRPFSAYCLFLGIWYFQINIHTYNMGRGWNQNVRF